MTLLSFVSKYQMRRLPAKFLASPQQNFKENICIQCYSLNYGAQSNYKVWSYKKNTLKLTCFNARSLVQQINGSSNYFEILGIEESFKLDEEKVKKAYRNLQTIYHPDKYGQHSKEDQTEAAEKSTIINKAYNALLHPIKRAEYLLKLRGHALEESEINMDASFLMEIMEINEELAEVNDVKTIQRISQKNDLIMKNLIGDLSQYFSANKISEAKSVVAKMKYYNNIYEKIKELEIKYGIVH